MELLHKLRRGKPNWKFQKAALKETTDELLNPARGWYQIHVFEVEKEPDFSQLEWCLDRKTTLVLLMIDIGACRERDLSRECLDRIGRILTFFSDRRYDMIVRAVYDHEGNAVEREPFFFTQVMRHLNQLGEILDDFADHIFVWQGMLVGSWGEMHTSRFLSTEKLVQMADALRYHRRRQTFLAVRKPVYWRMLHRKQDDGSLKCTDGMGLFDDGIFGSESHLGTFGVKAKELCGWEEPWAREDELAFLQELGCSAPNGGEVVCDPENAQTLTPETALDELRRMQISYLNKVYDDRVLDIWREQKYPGSGVWAGESLFSYIGAHLGYRFLVCRIGALPGGDRDSCRLELEIENTGFGGLYQEAAFWLEYGWEENVEKILLDDRLLGWKSGERRLLCCELQAPRGELFLRAERKRDGARIKFANFSDGEGRVLLGRFGA